MLDWVWVCFGVGVGVGVGSWGQGQGKGALGLAVCLGWGKTFGVRWSKSEVLVRTRVRRFFESGLGLGLSHAGLGQLVEILVWGQASYSFCNSFMTCCTKTKAGDPVELSRRAEFLSSSQ